MRNCIIISAYFIFSLFSCTSNQQIENRNLSNKYVEEQKTFTVQVTKLKYKSFNHEIISNGTLISNKSVDIKFNTEGIVNKILVRNGEWVTRGQKIAELDTFYLHNTLVQTKNALARAELDLKDILIGLGHNLEDSSDIPLKVMKLAKIKSGYANSKSQLDLAERNLYNATLKAPYDGVIANLSTQPLNTVSPANIFCTIIDNRQMDASFMILENELPFIKMGHKVLIKPYALSDITVEGEISEINPIVDKGGMIKVKAKVINNGNLFEGMKVRVKVLGAVARKFIVPKKAIVLRSDKEVLFTYKNGKAIWNYVESGFENMDSYTVVGETLNEGDSVIIEGNINLVHEAPVKVLENND